VTSILKKRLARLEAVRQKQAETAGREAFIVWDPFDGEKHLKITSSDAGRCWFQEMPGPGPQLSDFGKFALILHLTPAEMDS
jgi:hypothetical protein